MNSSSEIAGSGSIVSASPAASPSLTRQVARGAAWNVVGTLVKQTITLGATVVVARLLSPTDYAIGGLALSAMGLFTVLTAQGFAQALVQRKELIESICHSVFWAMVVGGLGVGGLTVGSASWIARFYGQPALVPLIWLLALGLVTSMIGAVPSALLQRAMRFRAINAIGMVASVLSAGLGIGLAWLGYGYWALIAPTFGTALARALGAFWVTGYRPAWTFRWCEFRSVSGFGFSLLGSNLVRYASDNGDYLIMGRFWSLVDFGRYYFAFERSRQPFDLVYGQLSSVLFPAFSKIQTDGERMRRALLRGTRGFCLLVFPLHVLIIGLADPLVPWIFGEQWRPAIPVFQVFASFVFVRGLAVLVPAGMLALERAQAVLAYNLFRAVVTLPALLYLGAAGTSILKTSVVLLIIWTVQTPFFIGYFYHQIDLSWAEAWRSLGPVYGATIAMGLVFVVSRLAASTVNWPLWVNLAISTVLASAVFVLLARRLLIQIVQQIRLALVKV